MIFRKVYNISKQYIKLSFASNSPGKQRVPLLLAAFDLIEAGAEPDATTTIEVEIEVADVNCIGSSSSLSRDMHLQVDPHEQLEVESHSSTHPMPRIMDCRRRLEEEEEDKLPVEKERQS